jgi:BolA protein
MKSRIEIIELTLRDNLNIHKLIIEDQGHLHKGHKAAKEGKMHLKISIVSNDFKDISPIQRHQKVYSVLGEFLKDELHALSLELRTTEELEIV